MLFMSNTNLLCRKCLPRHLESKATSRSTKLSSPWWPWGEHRKKTSNLRFPGRGRVSSRRGQAEKACHSEPDAKAGRDKSGSTRFQKFRVWPSEAMASPQRRWGAPSQRAHISSIIGRGQASLTLAMVATLLTWEKPNGEEILAYHGEPTLS